MPTEPRRGASRAARGDRNKDGGPGRALDEETPGSSQANQQTSSAAVPAADFPETTKDKEFIVHRSNYNSSKITATAALDQVKEMAVSMQEKVDGGTGQSILRRTAKRLQASMEDAEVAVEEQILLGTKLMSLSSYLAVALADSDPAQATQANSIQVAIGAEIKPLKREVEKVYDEYAHLLDRAEEVVSSQASSQ